MDLEFSSEEDDEVVFSPIRLDSRLQDRTKSRSSNNSNGSGPKRVQDNSVKEPEYNARGESSSGQNNLNEDDDMRHFREVSEKLQAHDVLVNGVTPNDTNIPDSIGRQHGTKGNSPNPESSSLAIDDMCAGAASLGLSFVRNGDLRKNNTFPLGGYENGQNWLERIPAFNAFHEAASRLGKRSSLPIEKVIKKKHRTLSDSRFSLSGTHSAQDFPVFEGTPAKTSNFEENYGVKFQVGGDDSSDQETFDTSTSSDPVASSSSSLDTKSLQEGGRESNEAHIREHLQGKLVQALKLEEFRCSSPTTSVLSVPLFPSKKRFSLDVDVDTKSIASDTQLVRSQSNSGKRLSSFSREASSSEDLIIRRTSLDEEDLVTEQIGEDCLMQSAIGDELLDCDDDISETPSIRSAGVLPAISSHGARERSFLVGNLTKHGSLLGSDELNRYFPDRRLKLFIGTWNMQKKGIPRNLNDFLLPKHQEYLQDMYVVGVQESTQDQKMWEIKLQETLGVNHVLAHSVSHGVLHMALFVRRDLIWFCSPFEDDRVTTRMVSQIKTKGAVAIAFQFFGTSLIFITSHFHSGETRVKERVEDYNRIKEKIKLPKKLKFDTYRTSPDDVTSRFDCTFWFGDLNFRVSLPHQIIHDEVNDPDNYDLREVLKGDQLMATMKRGRIFPGFNEHKIKFRPTYKFTAGSDKYDTSPKMRVPSYTDRILYKSKDNKSIDCTKYDSVSTLKKSDHRPVYGFFEVSLKPGRDSIDFGGGKFRTDVYEKAARLRAQGNYQNNSAVCNIL